MLETLQRVESLQAVRVARRSRPGRTVALAALLASAAVLGMSSQPACAEHLDKALGADGEIYQVTAGPCATLFPGGHTCDASMSVLALDTVAPGSPAKRQLVPGTADTDLKSTPALIYEDGSRTLFVVWVATHLATSTIELASYDGRQWSAPITIIGNPYSPKSPPQLAVTRDTHQEADAAGNLTARHRTVLHLVWAEDSQSGHYQAFYAPVIFEEGTWIGSVPQPALLNAFDLAEQAPQAPGGGPFTSPLVHSPVLQGGRDTSTVLAGFASDISGMLTTVEIDVLPEELRMLADSGSAAVLANSQYFPNQLDTLAAKVKTVILGSGNLYQPEALQAIATETQNQVTAGAQDVPHLDKARAIIVDIGRRFSMRGLRITLPGPIAPPKIAEVVTPKQPSHFLQFRVTATRACPPVAPDGLQLFLSRTGADALVAWTAAGAGTGGAGSQSSTVLVYSSSQPDGSWSAIHQLQLSDSLNLQQAYQVLAQRMMY
jgi:hypothetical protein